MTLQTVNFGSASDGSQGDTARAAFGKINSNFSDTTNAASRLVGTAAGQVMEVGAFGLGKNVDLRGQNASKASGTPTDVVAFGLRSGLAEGGPNGLAIPGLAGTAYGCLTYDVQWNDLAALPAVTRRFQTGDRCFVSSASSSTAWTAWREVVIAGGSPTLGTVNLTGGLNLSVAGASSTLAISGEAGQFRYIGFRTAGNARWDLGMNTDSEAGNNAGSNFYLNRFNDSGAFIDRPLLIDRANGETRLTRAAVAGPLRPGQYTLASLPSASAFSGYEIDVTDASGGAKRCRSDGSNWKILNTTTTVS